MNQLIVCGKKYLDTIMIVKAVTNGETNRCTNVIKKNGGLYNFFEIQYKNWNVNPLPCGKKEAFIVSDKSSSTRTSFVNDIELAILDEKQIEVIKANCDWLHVCYIDDFEGSPQIANIDIDYSLDFCTTKPREPYMNVLKKAKIVFDSRERKHLYDNITIDVPIIFHDEHGFEIVVGDQTIHSEANIPLKGLNVNGAGDIFAALFIENYRDMGLIQSSINAMSKTTKILKNRK